MKGDLIGFVKDFLRLHEEVNLPENFVDFSRYDYKQPFLESHFYGDSQDLVELIDKKIQELLVNYFENSEQIAQYKELLSAKVIANLMVKDFIKNFNHDRWLKEYCPLCGGKPGMAYIDGEGRRFLQCANCNMEWRFNRVICPFCLEESGNYSLFEVKSKNVRVEYCNKCRSYIKTFVFEKPDFLTSYELDVETLCLDEWAYKEGLVKNTSSMIGINFTF